MYLVLGCDPRLTITQVYEISPQLSFITNGDSLFDHIEPGSSKKLQLFLDSLLENVSVSGWELFISENNREFYLNFDGYQVGESLIIIAAEKQENKEELIEKWKNRLGLDKLARAEAKPGAQAKSGSVRSDIAIFDDISDMYNEMAALQRELAKNKAQLERSNALIERYANELEELVAERTEELRTSEEKFRGIFENSSLGIAIVDAQGVPLSCNSAFYSILEISEKTPVSTKTILSLIGSDDQSWENVFSDIVQDKSSSGPKEIEFHLSKEKTVWLSVNTYLINQDAETGPLLVIMVEDISKRKLDEQALLHAEKLSAVGRIAASLAHEINNPLQAIVGHISLARESTDQPGEIADYLRIASDELARIAQIVGDLRLASQKPTLKEKQPTDLVEIVNKVLVLVNKKAANNKINLSFQKDRSPMPALVNAGQIQQVILNLVINSMDAIGQNGKVVINVHQPGGAETLMISVEDDGVGISAQDKEKLFEPFFTTKKEGLGLGLYTSREIVEQHNGQLFIKDSEMGGARFEIHLPAFNV